MFFWFKKKKVVLECFTCIPEVYKMAKIDYLINYTPEWWKSLKKTTTDIDGKELMTIKTCQGFIDYYKTGIAIPSWFSMKIITYPNGTWQWESTNTFVDTNGSHKQKQFEPFVIDNSQNFKITSPWQFSTKKSKNFIWTFPTWNMRDNLRNIHLLPGVIDYKYTKATHINYILYPIKEVTKIYIEPLVPLVAIHPLFDDELEIKNFLVSEQEYNAIDIPANYLRPKSPSSYDFNFTGYKYKKMLHDKLNKQTEKKCPFNFNKF